MRLFLSCSRLTAFSWFESWIQLEHAFPSCCTHCDLSTCIPTPLRSLLFAPFADLGFDAKDLQTQLLMNSQANLLHNGSNRRQRTSRVSQAHLFQRKTNHQTVGTITHLFLNRIFESGSGVPSAFFQLPVFRGKLPARLLCSGVFYSVSAQKSCKDCFQFLRNLLHQNFWNCQIGLHILYDDGIFGRLFLPKWLDCGRTAS